MFLVGILCVFVILYVLHAIVYLWLNLMIRWTIIWAQIKQPKYSTKSCWCRVQIADSVWLRELLFAISVEKILLYLSNIAFTHFIFNKQWTDLRITLGKSLDFLPKSIFPAFMMWLLMRKWVSEKLRCLSDLNQSLYFVWPINSVQKLCLQYY